MQANEAKNKHTLYFHITPPKVKITYYHKKVFFFQVLYFKTIFIFLASSYNIYMQYFISLKFRCYSKIAMLALVILPHYVAKMISYTIEMQKCNGIDEIIEQSHFAFSSCCKTDYFFFGNCKPFFRYFVSLFKILIPLKFLLLTESKNNNKY